MAQSIKKKDCTSSNKILVVKIKLVAMSNFIFLNNLNKFDYWYEFLLYTSSNMLIPTAKYHIKNVKFSSLFKYSTSWISALNVYGFCFNFIIFNFFWNHINSSTFKYIYVSKKDFYYNNKKMLREFKNSSPEIYSCRCQ